MVDVLGGRWVLWAGAAPVPGRSWAGGALRLGGRSLGGGLLRLGGRRGLALGGGPLRLGGHRRRPLGGGLAVPRDGRGGGLRRGCLLDGLPGGRSALRSLGRRCLWRGLPLGDTRVGRLGHLSDCLPAWRSLVDYRLCHTVNHEGGSACSRPACGLSPCPRARGRPAPAARAPSIPGRQGRSGLLARGGARLVGAGGGPQSSGAMEPGRSERILLACTIKSSTSVSSPVAVVAGMAPVYVAVSSISS